MQRWKVRYWKPQKKASGYTPGEEVVEADRVGVHPQTATLELFNQDDDGKSTGLVKLYAAGHWVSVEREV